MLVWHRNLIGRAIVKRGLDNVAGDTTIPLALKNHPDMKDFGQIYAAVPMWPWSEGNSPPHQ